MDLSPSFRESLLTTLNATEFEERETLQELWSGYGRIVRVLVDGSPIIIKQICTAQSSGSPAHPRGWNTNRSHQRKLHSYQVESIFYQSWSQKCGNDCRVPELIAISAQNGEIVLAIEDLDAAGFPMRDLPSIEPCLKWLANFHATFIGAKPTGLWEIGTYWHLDTRPDEFAKLKAGPLKDAASAIDRLLNQARFQTIVHGDAKIANFCFDPSGKKVAAVDFQYAGGGCGMKDVAYLMGSCLSADQCARREDELLNLYFGELTGRLASTHPEIDAEALIQEWRQLYPVAWADFHRFLLGWCPGHPKLDEYSLQMVSRSLEALSK